ncbi:MAG TPA: glycosyltransferase family 4 protein [Rhizomicrobium sp.]|nr:glycosyltransferase family 4 protein [Rhizomicrobium sp.]
MIVFATQNFLPDVGGTQGYVTGLADAFSGKGQAVSVFCDASSSGAAHAVDQARSYSIRRFGGPRPIMRRIKARAINQRIAAGGVDVVVTDTWKSLEFLSAPLLANTKVICLAHGSEFLVAPGSAKERRMRACLAKADIVAANSAFTADLAHKYTSGKTKVQAICPGIIPPVGAPRDIIPRMVSGGPHIITIARLEPRKGIDMVIRALPALRALAPDLIYDIIGKGEDKERLVALTAELGVTEMVRFHGFIPEAEKAERLLRADIFALPNRREPESVEGFGIVFQEAAAFGLPSLAGSDGGTRNAVTDGVTGRIVDGSDAQAVEDALRQMLKNEEMRKEMGRAAHKRFWSEFAWDAAITRFEALLKTEYPFAASR